MHENARLTPKGRALMLTRLKVRATINAVSSRPWVCH